MATCPQCGHRYPSGTAFCARDGAVLTPDISDDRTLAAVIEGKYEIQECLGQGGMGTVYRANHILLGKPVAIKLIRPELVTSPNILRRFQREARELGRLNHPNIVAVYDLGQTARGDLYIAMELVTGRNLKEIIRAAGSLDEARTVAISLQVARALVAAHGHQVIHRDLKPQNILLTADDDGREMVKLLDFGIAKSFDSPDELTTTGAILGTPHYMAPEQGAGEAIDARVDVYSFGVVLYEMLVGCVPFTGTSTPAILMRHASERPVAPSEQRRDLRVSPALEAIALRCLEKKPADRFQSARDLLAAIENIPQSGMAGADAKMAASVASDQPSANQESTEAARSAFRRILVMTGVAAVVVALVAMTYTALRGRPPRNGGTNSAPPDPAVNVVQTPQQPSEPKVTSTPVDTLPTAASQGTRQKTPQQAIAQPPKSDPVAPAIAEQGRATTSANAATEVAATPPPAAPAPAPQPPATQPVRPTDPTAELSGRCNTGEVKACTQLAAAYETGSIVPKDLSAAARFSQKACDLKDGESCNRLAAMYESGGGVAKDSTRARDLYIRVREIAVGPAGSDQILRAGRDVPMPAIIKRPPAVDYPKAANYAGKEGWVLVEATIGLDGKVVQTKVVKSIALLDDAAQAAVRQYQFATTVINNTAVSVVCIVPVEFSMKRGGRP